jgi:hypothetical protein
MNWTTLQELMIPIRVVVKTPGNAIVDIELGARFTLL